MSRNNPGQCEELSAKPSAGEPKLRALAKDASGQGDYGASVVIGYVTSSSNQDAKNVIASELSALEEGDGSRFLSMLGSTSLSAAMGGSPIGTKATGTAGSKLPSLSPHNLTGMQTRRTFGLRRTVFQTHSRMAKRSKPQLMA